MPSTSLPKVKDLNLVLRIAKALDDHGYPTGSVQVTAEGWSVSWAKTQTQLSNASPLETWKSKHGHS